MKKNVFLFLAGFVFLAGLVFMTQCAPNDEGFGTTTTANPDTTPPVFVTAPSSTNVHQTLASVRASINEAGVLYAVVVADGATAPSALQVKSGLNADGTNALASGHVSAAASNVVSLNLSGLTAESALDIYVVAADASGNVQSGVIELDITTTALIGYTFTFKPGFSTFDGQPIDNVYLCGDFNDWQETTSPMAFNTTNSNYELSLDLADGTHLYKFRVTFAAPVDIWSWDMHNQTSIWFTDPASASYEVDTQYYSVNSALTIPYTAPSNFTVSGIISNAAGMETLVYIAEESGEHWYWDPIQALAQVDTIDFSFRSTAKNYFTIELTSSNEYTNANCNTFRYAYYSGGLSNDLSLPAVSMAFTNGNMDPAPYALASNGNILFSWDAPAGLGALDSVDFLLISTNNQDFFYTNLPGTASNFNFTGDASITGNKAYIWFVAFPAVNHWNGYSMYIPFYITNY